MDSCCKVLNESHARIVSHADQCLDDKAWASHERAIDHANRLLAAIIDHADKHVKS